ncbi:hypothetical protein HKD37_14G040760 [Glycine soja]
MSEIEEVQEQMKADMEVMKEQMTIMMEAMMSMRKMMEVNTATVVTASTTTEVDPTHLSGLNQVNRSVSDIVGQGGEVLGNTGSPHVVQVQSKHSFPPYGLPPNFTLPNVAHSPDENVDNFTPIPIESQQTQFGHAQVPQPMRKTHEVPWDHTLADFKLHLGYATKEQAFGGVSLPNTLGGPQYHPQPQPLHFAMKGGFPAMRWRDLAAQVAPPMMEREMITMIVDTLPVFYYEKMVGYMPSSFTDLVFVGERIEVGLRIGKFDYATSMDRKLGANGENKKERETHVVTVVPTWPNFPLAQQYQYSANTSPSYYPSPYPPRTPNHP